VAARVAHVCANPNVGVWTPVERDHAEFVDPLVAVGSGATYSLSASNSG